MNSKHFRFYIISLSLIFLSISAASPTQADSNYPMMGRGDHRSMMGYGYGKPAESDEWYEASPYRGWGMGGPGCDQMGPDMMESGQMWPGMMGYGHMGSGMGGGMRAIMQLNLNDTQRKSAREIHRQHRRDNWSRMGEMMDLQDKLEELYDAATPDAKAIGEVYAALFEIKRKRIESTIQAQNKMRALLTKEQQKTLDEEQRRPWRHMQGYGHMR